MSNPLRRPPFEVPHGSTTPPPRCGSVVSRRSTGGTIIDPIVVTAAYGIFMLVMLPVIGLAAGWAPWRIVGGAMRDQAGLTRTGMPSAATAIRWSVVTR